MADAGRHAVVEEVVVPREFGAVGDVADQRDDRQLAYIEQDCRHHPYRGDDHDALERRHLQLVVAQLGEQSLNHVGLVVHICLVLNDVA